MTDIAAAIEFDEGIHTVTALPDERLFIRGIGVLDAGTVHVEPDVLRLASYSPDIEITSLRDGVA